MHLLSFLFNYVNAYLYYEKSKINVVFILILQETIATSKYLIRFLLFQRHCSKYSFVSEMYISAEYH